MDDSARDQFRKILGGRRPSPPPSSPASQEREPPGEPGHPSEQAQVSPAPPLEGSDGSSMPHQPGEPGPVSPSRLRPASPSPTPAPERGIPVPSLTDRLKPHVPGTEAPPEPAQRESAPEQAPQVDNLPDARLFLQELRTKMARLSEEFAQGKVNTKQFQEIYAHYQRQRRVIERAIYDMPSSDAWRGVVTFGQTGLLRQRHAGKVLSYAIYDNATSLPLASVGDFAVDTALLVPMLSSFRSATAEMFGAGLRSTEIEGGRWLCFVPGKYTTLFVIFSVEPARIQMTLIEDLHRDFEVANRASLESGEGDEAAQQFTRLWALERTI